MELASLSSAARPLQPDATHRPRFIIDAMRMHTGTFSQCSALGALRGHRASGRGRSTETSVFRWICLLLALVLGAAGYADDDFEHDAELDPETLEARGATIGRVLIRVNDIFDPDDPDEDRALYRFANRMHINTREGVIEDLVLFAPGDDFDARLLDESARLLRARPYLSDATVTAYAYNEETNTVDVEVDVRDAWSFDPEIRLGREGGENDYRLGLSESNLLGTGKTLTAYYNSDVDRAETYVSFLDPNVRGSRTRLEVDYADASDGRRRGLAGERPFYALDTRWAAGGRLLDDSRIDSMYDLGEVVDEFRHERRFAEVRGGLSRGLVEGRTLRWLAGFTYDESRFSPSADMPQPLLLPENRKLAYPWVGLELIEDDYRVMTELETIGRTEDVPIGLQLSLRLGFARTGFGADRDATLFEASAHKGWEPARGRLIMFDAAAGGRREDGGTRNGTLETSVRYYHRNFEKHMFLTSLNTFLSSDLDAENQVLLGGDSGLRGYPIRYQGGEHRAVLTLEQRFHTEWYPLRLFRVAWAAFFDAGRVWGVDPRTTRNYGMLYDVGVGLRLASPRSSGRNIIHIDLAFPLNGGASISSAQLLVETKQSF